MEPHVSTTRMWGCHEIVAVMKPRDPSVQTTPRRYGKRGDPITEALLVLCEEDGRSLRQIGQAAGGSAPGIGNVKNGLRSSFSVWAGVYLGEGRGHELVPRKKTQPRRSQKPSIEAGP